MKSIVYVASPMSTYETARYAQKVKCIQEWAGQRFKNPEILAARDLYADHDDFERKWSQIVRSLRAMVVFTAENGTIGAGVAREISDCVGVGVLVFVWFDNAKAPINIDQTDFQWNSPINRREIATLCPRGTLPSPNPTPTRTPAPRAATVRASKRPKFLTRSPLSR